MRLSPLPLLVLLCLGSLLAQESPVPVWSGEGAVPPGTAEQTVYLTPDRHTILVRLPAGEGEGRELIRVPLHNRVRPSLVHQVSAGPKGGLRYEYTLSNGEGAADAIGALSLIVPAQDRSLQVPPVEPAGRGWAGAPAFAAVARQPIFPEFPVGQYVLWVRRPGTELVAGQATRPLTVLSAYRPGLSTAWAGSADPPRFDQSWPAAVFQELEKLEDRHWREQYRITAAPAFAPETPRREIVEHLRLALPSLERHRWLDPGSAFVRELAAVLADPAVRRMRESPRGEVERAIATVVRLSLGVELP